MNCSSISPTAAALLATFLVPERGLCPPLPSACAVSGRGGAIQNAPDEARLGKTMRTSTLGVMSTAVVMVVGPNPLVVFENPPFKV